MQKKIRAAGTGVLAVVWAALTVFAWFAPAKEESLAERRKLKQMPELTAESLLDGRFMTDFETYTQDQFPARDTFRSTKALFHRYVLGNRDNNGIYLSQGHFSKLDYPYDEESLLRATGIFNGIYQQYLKDAGCTVVMAAVPDKGYYLAQENGYPAMDYEAMFSELQQQMPWAYHVDLTDCLSIDSYYRTDTHWKQETLLPAAQKLAAALGVTQPQESDYTVRKTQTPFYGVYYGQAALPAQPDTICLLENSTIDACRVYHFETQDYTSVYEEGKLTSKDPYEVYLSGSQSLLVVENPNAQTDRELIVFRDSFGSSIVPLLVQDYRTVTLVDVRYMPSAMLGKYLTFQGQDVLFLYSTMVLNDSTTLK